MKKQYIQPSTETTQMGAAQIFATSMDLPVGGKETDSAMAPEYKPWDSSWSE